MVKYKVANAGSILHISGEIEEKWETKRSVMSKAPMGDSHSQTFTTTCAFERRQLSAFPIALGAVNKNPAKHLFVHVFCVCQLPESYDSNMIQCDKCSLWYHFKCMNLHSDSTVPDTWYCSTCN